MAKGGLGQVKGDGGVLGLFDLHHVEQRLEKAVADAGGNAGGGAQAPVGIFGEGVVGAKGQGMAIDQHQGGLGGGVGGHGGFSGAVSRGDESLL